MVEIAENGVTIRASHPLEFYKKGDNIHELNGQYYTVITNGVKELESLIDDGEDLSELVTTFVEDFSYMFEGTQIMNGSVQSWDVSNAYSLCGMFSKSHMFNDDITHWNTKNIRYMQNMFDQSYCFNQNISGWNTSNVVNMSCMFKDAYSFNQDISKWNVTKVTSMCRMFYNAKEFKHDVIFSWSPVMADKVGVSQMYVGSCIGYHKIRRVPTIANTKQYQEELLLKTSLKL